MRKANRALWDRESGGGRGGRAFHRSPAKSSLLSRHWCDGGCARCCHFSERPTLATSGSPKAPCCPPPAASPLPRALLSSCACPAGAAPTDTALCTQLTWEPTLWRVQGGRPLYTAVHEASAECAPPPPRTPVRMFHTLFLFHAVAHHGLPPVSAEPSVHPAPWALSLDTPPASSLAFPRNIYWQGHVCPHSQAGTRKLLVVEGLIGSQTSEKSKSWTLLWVTPRPETCLEGAV